MGKIRKKIKNLQLAVIFAGSIFIILVATIFILAVGIFLLQKNGVPVFEDTSRFPLFWLAVSSLMIGTLIAFVFCRLPLKPILTVCKAADKIADGDYGVRIHLKGPEEFVRLSDSFNHMAEELGSVELLRSDFVNNFSHEFKTPIVSIRGFAKMLKYGDLTQDERNEYLDVMIAESERLADLAAKVLELSKFERQAILTDKKEFNVSEQIRIVIAMLCDRWQKKRLVFDFDCGEVCVVGNEEMLKQVWINLLDNAIKFSPDGGTIAIRLRRTVSSVIVAVSNGGSTLTAEAAGHIFDKFYQADRSHTTDGCGLGLAIVKRIVELHGGRVSVGTENVPQIVFRVELPNVG